MIRKLFLAFHFMIYLRNISKFISLVVCFLCTEPLFTQPGGDRWKKYSAREVREDIEFLQKKLEANHPNLYLYHSKSLLDAVFDSLRNNLPDSLSPLEVYKHITILSSLIKDGHTLILPGETILEDYNKNSRFLPYHFSIFGNQLYTGMVCTADSSLETGDEVLRINNYSAAQIIETLMERQVRDGYNLTYPTWILNNYFREYYSFIFGHPDELSISYKHQGKLKNAVIRALPKDSIYSFRKTKYPAWSNVRKPGEGITMNISKDKKYAILTIKDFHKEVLKDEYHQDFKTEIRQYFNQLEQNGVQHLILDIRDNQGGDLEYGVYLLAHLIDKPFKMLDGFYKLNHSTDRSLEKAIGESTSVHQPLDHVFRGNLYVLINGGSFSNSGIISACLRREDRAIFIGQETGGNKKVIAGDANDYNLPNTKIRVEIPTRQYMINEALILDGRGIFPDIEINPAPPTIEKEKDKAVEAALKRIYDK